MASHVSTDDESSHEDIQTHDTSVVKIFESPVFDGNESENDEVDVSELQNAFQELFEESIKLKKANLKLEASLKERVKVINESALIEDLRTRERALREKLEYIEGERDSLKGLMETLKKELLAFEERNILLESNILELQNKLKDSSNVKFDLECRSEKLDKILGTVQIKNDMCGLGFNSCNESTNKVKTTVLGESTRKDFRDHSLDTHFRHVFTCTHCGRKGHLRKFCFDLKRISRKTQRKVTKVFKFPTPQDSKSSLIWVRKTDLVALQNKVLDSHLLSHASSLAKSKG
jgi:hypothetical protein